MTFKARPVWKRTSPIRTKSGIGVKEKLITAAALFLSIWFSPASPPRNNIAPTILIAMNEKATGTPMNRSSVEPPRSSREASCQDIPTPSNRPYSEVRTPRGLSDVALAKPRKPIPHRQADDARPKRDDAYETEIRR